MAAQSVNITIEQGTDFDTTFTVNNPDGTPIPLSNYTAASKLKKYPASSTSTSFSTSITASKGQVTISMGNTTTAALTPGRHYYDVTITSPGGSKTRVVEGMALVTPSVSV